MMDSVDSRKVVYFDKRQLLEQITEETALAENEVLNFKKCEGRKWAKSAAHYLESARFRVVFIFNNYLHASFLNFSLILNKLVSFSQKIANQLVFVVLACLFQLADSVKCFLQRSSYDESALFKQRFSPRRPETLCRASETYDPSVNKNRVIICQQTPVVISIVLHFFTVWNASSAQIHHFRIQGAVVDSSSMEMEGTNGLNEGVNPNDKLPPPPSLLQPNGNVPSIFLAPGSTGLGGQPVDVSPSNSQTTQTTVWNGGVDMQQQRPRSPPPNLPGGSLDSYKMKTCASTQCGSSGYEGLAPNIGGCQPPPLQTRQMYPPTYNMQQQQLAIPIRSIHQHHHHHHHGMPGPCHPHHPQHANMSVAPHLERMIHGGSSAVAVAAAQQMRSMVMNHYQPNAPGYPHQTSGPSTSTYYHQTVTTAGGSTPYMEFNHQHPTHGISAAAAAAVQYAQQQQQHHQRMVSSATASLNPYRQLPIHHQQKVLSSSQAAAAYQSAYQQHQYNQYLQQQQQQHHGMIASHHQNGPGTTTASVMHQRMLGIPMANLQQQAYLNRASLPHLHPQQHNHGYSTNCQPALMPNYTGASHQHQLPQQHQPQLVHSIISSSASSVSSNNSSTTTPESSMDINNNNTNGNNNASNKSVGSSFTILGTKQANKKTSSEATIVSRKSPLGSSMKLGSIKLSIASPEKSVKLKTTRSVTKLRDRQPRLVVGQKKKSVGNISGSGSSRKLKSLKALASIDGINSCSKRFTTSAVVDSEGNGDAKRSKKVGRTEGVLSIVKTSVDDASAEEKIEKKVDENELIQVNRSVPDGSFSDDQKDEYVPTHEEMRKYLERLNTCNTLNIPLYYAYSVFHGKLSHKDNKSISPVDSTSVNNNSAEGIYTARVTATTLFYQHFCNPLEQSNFTTCCYNDWGSPAVSAETEWQNFQDDMAVLEAYFPLLSTMEQSERAEKLDTIYTYEGQMKIMHSSAPATTSCTLGRDDISPPCNCLQETAASCSCCYNYMPGMMQSSMTSSEECGNLGDQLMCRSSASYVGESSTQFVIDRGFHHPHSQPQYVSTPLSSRRGYTGSGGVSHFYDTENGHYFKDNSNVRSRAGARKRSSSYPSRKSGRRSSGSRDHLKSETESFLDELISTANDEKLSKQRNNSGGEVTAPEIQCEVDFPSLQSSAAISYNKRHAKKIKQEESVSARDEYMASSSTGSEESESNNSACSSSPQSAHNTSSEGDFDGGSEVTLVNNKHHSSQNIINSKTSHAIILSPPCGVFDHDAGACCSEHLWDDFRGDEIVTMQSESFGPQTVPGASCVPIPMASLTNLISHCTCRRVDTLCPTRPPPGFEHLARPAFPIELYDPSLLGNLIGGQLPREVLTSLDASSLSRKQFEEMEELLLSLTCCEKHAVDQMLHSRRSSISLSGDDELNEDSEDDWESLEKAIKNVLNEWTEELGFRKRMQDILFSLNLHEVYGGCCKNIIPLEHTEPESTLGTRSLSSKPLPTATEESASLLLHGGANKS